MKDKPLIINGKKYLSRLIVGTGKYKDLKQTKLSVEASSAEMVTVAIRRTNIGQNKNEESLLKVYQVNGLKEEKALINLFSPDYEYEVRDFLIKNPEFINKKTILKLTASDDIDQLHKGNYPRHLPEDRRRINDFQLMMYDKLVEQNKIDKIFNNYLFQKGDSRNPELAGIGGALVGSFFTIIITLLLSLSLIHISEPTRRYAIW